MTAPGRFYVYVLIDPRNDEIFYVGKGCGNRHAAHLKEWKAGRVVNADKFARIGEIVRSGHKPMSKIVMDGLQERRAFAEEAILIANLGISNLTNLVHGGDPDHERRKMVAWASKMIPRIKHISRWKAEGNKICATEFRDQYARAREVQADFWAEQIIEISDTPLEGTRTEDGKDGIKTVREDMLGHRRLQVDTRKWLMARMAPKKYGDRLTQEVSGPAGGPIQTQEISPRETLADRIAGLIARGGASGDIGKPH
jgi:hypothetical protein